MNELELELFGSSSDSDSDAPTADAKDRVRVRQVHHFTEAVAIDNDGELPDPIFESIMACIDENVHAGADRATSTRKDLDTEYHKHSPHAHIPGLCLHTNVLSHEDQSKLMAQITEKNFFKAGQQNQAMCFGQRDLSWLAWLEKRLFENGVLSEPYCQSEWTSRSPLFDQSIMNLYRPGDGIKPHVDLARFEDGIVVISLMSAINMDFYRALSPISPQDPPDGHCNPNRYTKGNLIEDTKERPPDYSVRLEPGSVITMQGPSRYEWEHGIQETLHDLVNDEWIKRKIRASITLRKMRSSAWEVGPSTPLDSNRRDHSDSLGSI